MSTESPSPLTKKQFRKQSGSTPVRDSWSKTLEPGHFHQIFEEALQNQEEEEEEEEEVTEPKEEENLQSCPCSFSASLRDDFGTPMKKMLMETFESVQIWGADLTMHLANSAQLCMTKVRFDIDFDSILLSHLTYHLLILFSFSSF